MIHEMKLNSEPFEKIKNGKKDIEVRLYDDKRKLIKIGDRIIFKKLPNTGEELTAEIIGLSIFPSFKVLFSNFDNSRFGHQNLNLDEQLKKIRKIYSENEESKNGVIGIHLKLIHP